MNGAPRDFLFEIGCEELPAAAARSALEQMRRRALDVFHNHLVRIEAENISIWVTPRRITTYIRDVPNVQEAAEIADRGPRESVAFDPDGAPTRAAEGFARAKGVSVESLEVREFEGQRFIFAVRKKSSRPVGEVIGDICLDLLDGISFPKTMRWDGDQFRFSRPVRWLAAKFGDETVKFSAHGIACGDISRGHRFLSGGEVELASAGAYRQELAAAAVVVDQEERRRMILEGLATEAGKLGASFADPAGELEEVIYLVENPSVHAGAFGEEHLRLPDRVLVTAMQSHQRYFPLKAEDGSLAAGFLYVMNGDPAAAAQITEGNERVLEGRIEDAEFSYDKDLATGIEAMQAGLSAVVFHRRLGSLADKSSRLWALAESLSDLVNLDGAARQAAAAAARLAKADLVSIMVQEFSDLQGFMGSVYAGLEGFPADVCQAVAEQYLPTAAGGRLPDSLPGAVLAICDKVDNIVAAFAVDELPTGSRDPYGLRRAAAGIAEICQSFDLDFSLTALLTQSHRLYIEQKADVDKDTAVVDAAYAFICDRLEQRLVEDGMPVELAGAARASGQSSLIRIMSLAVALDAFRREPEFEDFHTAYFRCSKIAAKAGREAAATEINEALFAEESERELFRKTAAAEPRIGDLAAAQDYAAALREAASLRGPVDRFFDDVLVMAEDEKVRNNRLALVTRVAGLLGSLGDPILVAAAPKAAK